MAAPQGSFVVTESEGSSLVITDGARLHDDHNLFVTVTWDQPVVGFTANDITSSDCTITNFTAVSTSVYTFAAAVSNVALIRRDHSFRVSYTGAQNGAAEVGIGANGQTHEDFTFFNDVGATVIAVTQANGNTHGVVRLPECDPAITFTAYNRNVLFTNKTALPAGHTPWTHYETYTIVDVDSTSVVWNQNHSQRSSDDRKKIVVDEATRRLEQTDFMALTGETMPTGFATYRASLRSIIASFNIASPPVTVTFPEVPNFSAAGTSPYPGDIALYVR